jgi:hypothetical protein
MKRLIIRALCLGAVIAIVVAAAAMRPQGASTGERPGNEVLRRALDIELGRGSAPAKSPFRRVSGGTMSAVVAGTGALEARIDASGARAGGGNRDRNVGFARSSGTNGCPNTFGGQDGRRASDDRSDGRSGDRSRSRGGPPANVRVNQDCTLRRQAEEWGAVNPTDFSNILGGQNDSVIGFNHCGYDWSFDAGSTWGSVGTAPPPFWQEILDDDHTSDACSDPAGTFDHLGNAYAVGLLFDINSAASAIFVAKSNAPNGGSFYHTPRPLPFQEYRATPMGRVASDNDPDIFHDKELMIGDTRPGSPKQGRLYVTWTRFEVNATPPGGRSPIVFSQSTDSGSTWSPATIISGAAGSFCTAGSGTPDNPNACDQDQGSHPAVGPDGTVYVVFGNANTPLAGVSQVVVVRCRPTNTCNSPSDWEGPFRVGDLIGTHPFGPSPAGCPPGAQCLPPNGYRAPEFTTMSISADRNGRLFVAWADHRNGKPPCTAANSPGAPPCNHDVFYAYSLDRGTTWSPTRNVTAPFGETAQWQPWSDVTGDGKKLEVAFYDRHYGDCEFTGCNDITLASIADPASARPSIRYRRITTDSMPNLTTATNPVQAGFLGDYMWLEVSRHSFDQQKTHIWWADTRPLPYRPEGQQAPEEDVYFAIVDGKDANGKADDGG